jgi:hypothetical protein
MRRVSAALVSISILVVSLAGCGKGGKDVTGPTETPLRLGLVTAEVNGKSWSSLNAAGSPIAECYLFVLSNGDSVLQVNAWQRPGNDTLASGILFVLPSPRPGTIPLEATNSATWYVHRVVGADTLETWWGTGGDGSGTMSITRLNLTADSVYATFSFFGVAPDTVRVENGRLALAYNVVHATSANAGATLRSRAERVAKTGGQPGTRPAR